MKYLAELSAVEAKQHFLKSSSYFKEDLPDYINFEPVLEGVAKVLAGGSYHSFCVSQPADLPEVNYNFISNKDGRFAWRPHELMHPAIYVSLVNLMCEDVHWAAIAEKLTPSQNGVITCCSSPVVSTDHQTDQATQVKSWWHEVEQQSLRYSLAFSHLLHTDVTDCYGSVYTHSIAWALHGKPLAKQSKGKDGLLGEKIDTFIRASRYGQTNGISQGSLLMDVIAELVLGYVDQQIIDELQHEDGFHILRYRDDYRIFANSDEKAEHVLKIVSDMLREVGMKLGVSKTILSTNIVEGSIKPDKLAGIELQDLGETNAKTIQKQLLRLHAFGLRFPNSGALRRLMADMHEKVSKQVVPPDDLEVQVAIVTDIGLVSPLAFPAVAGILSHLIALAPPWQQAGLWAKVSAKMARVPYNGYLEVWLQRVTKPLGVDVQHHSDEAICRLVDGENVSLWDSSWIGDAGLLAELAASKIVISDAATASDLLLPEEIKLFVKNALTY